MKASLKYFISVSDMGKLKLNMGNIKLKENNKLVEDLLKMLERGSLNDVKIKLSDEEIVANKDILMARSDYFASMFSNNKFIEGETGSVDMSHCSKAVMERIIKYLFSGEATFDQMYLAQLLELVHTTDMMLLAVFKETVATYVEHYITVNNASDDAAARFFPELVSGLKLASKYKLTFTKRISWELYQGLKVIPNDVTATDAFKTLPFNLIKDIFLADLWQDQRGKFKAFMVWLTENEASEKQKTEIVESFNFEDFTAEELLTSVRDSGLYSAKRIDERVLDLLKNKDMKINELKNTIDEAKKYIPTFQLHRFQAY